MRVRPSADRSKLLSYGFTALLLILGAAWFFMLRPQSLGGPVAFVVVSGNSMEPTYEAGDLILMRRSAAYREGDIIEYTVPADEAAAGTHVIHRIVGQDEAGFITRGDNNKGNDLWRPQDGDIAGKEWVRFPGAGNYLTRVRTPLVLASLAAMLTMYTVLTSGKKPQTGAGSSSNGEPWRDRLRRGRGRLRRTTPLLQSSRAPAAALGSGPTHQPESFGPERADSGQQALQSFFSDPRASYALAAIVAIGVACLAFTSFQSGKDPSIH